LRLHVLTPGFISPNTRAFLFPLIVWRRQLAAAGIEVRLCNHISDALMDCDAVLVDSKFHRDRWREDAEGVLQELQSLADRTTLVYCDTTDSTGWVQSEVLPVVDLYLKSQLLRDRSGYLQPLYGHRLYTDYYHRRHGVEDDIPEWSTPVPDPASLEKLRLSWNSGLADYSLFGPYRMALYMRLPVRGLLRFPAPIAVPGGSRPHPVASRFATQYTRNTVGWQRQRIHQKLTGHAQTGKISRRLYFSELSKSKVVVSPFGFGEINYKDYEAILNGALLLKPDMSHLTTWPDLFEAGETMLTHSWDLNDLLSVLEQAVGESDKYIGLAEEAQARYRRHTTAAGAAELFAERLAKLLRLDECAHA